MTRYRKKPVVIDAWLFTGDKKDSEFFATAPVWLVDALHAHTLVVGYSPNNDHIIDHLFIATLEGEMRANPGDWIIKGISDELYPCQPDIFEATYEAIEG